jgi:hypothetical protein
VAGRYVIYPVADEDGRGLNLRRPLALSDTIDVARQMADRLSSGSPWGVAILDTLTGIVDTGRDAGEE